MSGNDDDDNIGHDLNVSMLLNHRDFISIST